jgi:hypothetical protein
MDEFKKVFDIFFFGHNGKRMRLLTNRSKHLVIDNHIV